MAGACIFGRDKMAVQVQVGSPDLGSNTHESTLEGCFQSIENAWREYIVQEDCFVHSFPKQYYSGFEESSSSEEHQEASQESDSYSFTALINMWKSLHAEKVHLSAEKTQKKEAVLKNAQIRVKTATDQGNAEENKKAGQSKQNNGKSQTSNRARAVANPSNANGGGDNDDDDDDDEGRKPRPSNLTKKKLDCDRPARQKSSSSSEGMEWLTQDTVTPTKPGGGPEGVLPTRQNQQAVRGLYQDSNIQACHNAIVSMPSRSALTTGEVIRGGHPEVCAFVDLFQQLKTRDPANSQGLHQGVLCHEDLVPFNGQYRENQAFIVLRILGRGAFGTAYLLQDRTSGKIFVGKQVSLSRYAPSEPKIWSGLHHESIAKFLGVLLTNSWVIFLSSYLKDSKTLQNLIGQSVLRQGRALMIIRQVVGAVDYLRHLNISHNDIKSDNIVVGEGDRAQLIDFGLSRRMPATKPPSEASQITERELFGMDIKSLGCTLAHMITGLPCCSHLIEINEFITGLLSYNMQPRVRRFIVQMVNGELTAAQALEIADRLCSTPDMGRDEPEPERKDVATGMPQHVPQTPFTYGPPGNSYLSRDIPPAEQPCPERSLSDLYVHGDVEPRRDEKIEMEVDDPDGPETFNEGAFTGQPREVHSGTPSVGPRIMNRLPRSNAAKFDQPLNSNPRDTHQNLAPTSTAHAGMSGTSTSGFVSNSSGHTGDYQNSTSRMDTSTATPAGHEAVPPSSTHTIGIGEHQGDEAMEM